MKIKFYCDNCGEEMIIHHVNEYPKYRAIVLQCPRCNCKRLVKQNRKARGKI